MATVTRRRALVALAPLLGVGARSRLLVAGGIAGGMLVIYATGLVVSA